MEVSPVVLTTAFANGNFRQSAHKLEMNNLLKVPFRLANECKWRWLQSNLTFAWQSRCSSIITLSLSGSFLVEVRVTWECLCCWWLPWTIKKWTRESGGISHLRATRLAAVCGYVAYASWIPKATIVFWLWDEIRHWISISFHPEHMPELYLAVKKHSSTKRCLMFVCKQRTFCLGTKTNRKRAVGPL